MPPGCASDALAVNCTLHLPVPSAVKPFHVAAASPEQSVSWTQAPSQDLEQRRRELPSLVVEVAHHNVPAA
jgi:hypothetical protein